MPCDASRYNILQVARYATTSNHLWWLFYLLTASLFPPFAFPFPVEVVSGNAACACACNFAAGLDKASLIFCTPSRIAPAVAFCWSKSIDCWRVASISALRFSDMRHSTGNFGLILIGWCLRSRGMSAKSSLGSFIHVSRYSKWRIRTTLPVLP